MKVFSRDDVLRCMRKAVATLKSNPNPRYFELVEHTLRALAEEEPELHPIADQWQETVQSHSHNGLLAIHLVEAYWYLVSLGYIVPQPQGKNPPNFSGIRITELGHEWTKGNDPSPEDQQGFLSALRAQVPQIDPIIDQYVQEAVAAFARNMFFASAVMIGAASEKTIYLLMDALAGAVKSQTERTAVLKAVNERGITSMLKCLQHNLSLTKKTMPWGVHEGADTHLLSLFEAIRVQRNEAVHPQAGKVTPQTVRLTLASFPGACKKAHDLIQWFQANQF